jgi:hypothetical protein
MREVVLMAFGKPAYGKMAFNLALTIKHFSPDLAIRLIYEPNALSGVHPSKRWVFNSLVEIEQADLYENGKFNPGKAKTRIYKYLVADESIYLDVDALCNKPLEPLFDLCTSYYHTQVVGKQKPSQGRDFPEMQWAYLDDIVNHYGISEDTTVYATNSSFAYIKKGKEAEKLFKQIQENIDNPLPKLRLAWGGSFPDELALNVALGQVKHDPSLPVQPVYFQYGGAVSNFTALRENHFIMGYYGGKRFTCQSLWEYYDRFLKQVANGFGMVHEYKSNHLIKDKHANKTVL